MKKQILWGSIAALVSTIFISSNSTFTKILLERFSTYSLAAIAQIFSVITIAFFFGALPELKKLKNLSYKVIWGLVIVGILSAVIQPLFLYTGLVKTSAINGALISRTQMVIVSIISTLWLRERITPHQIVGTFIMLGGAYFIATHGLLESLSWGSGDLLLFAAAFFGALSTTVFKRFSTEVSPQLVVLTRNLLGILLNLTIVPFIFQFKHDFNPIFDVKVLAVLTVFSLIVIVGSQSLWYKAVEVIPANRASNIGMTSPIFGVLFAMGILGEKFTAYHMIGGILILIGLFFTTLHHQKNPQHATHLKARSWNN
ncbi:MAG: DMT family transporter [Candidatus Peregrinibacteria bacterium]